MNSLIVKTIRTEVREGMTTKSAVIESQKVEQRAYQKEHRSRTLATYNKEKATIDNLSSDELTQYITDNADSSHNVRTGIHSMKMNSYEHAVIKKAIELTGSKSSRELYIRFCKQAIADSNTNK